MFKTIMILMATLGQVGAETGTCNGGRCKYVSSVVLGFKFYDDKGC